MNVLTLLLLTSGGRKLLSRRQLLTGLSLSLLSRERLARRQLLTSLTLELLTRNLLTRNLLTGSRRQLLTRKLLTRDLLTRKLLAGNLLTLELLTRNLLTGGGRQLLTRKLLTGDLLTGKLLTRYLLTGLALETLNRSTSDWLTRNSTLDWGRGDDAGWANHFRMQSRFDDGGLQLSDWTWTHDAHLQQAAINEGSRVEAFEVIVGTANSNAVDGENDVAGQQTKLVSVGAWLDKDQLQAFVAHVAFDAELDLNKWSRMHAGMANWPVNDWSAGVALGLSLDGNASDDGQSQDASSDFRVDGHCLFPCGFVCFVGDLVSLTGVPSGLWLSALRDNPENLPKPDTDRRIWTKSRQISREMGRNAENAALLARRGS